MNNIIEVNNVSKTYKRKVNGSGIIKSFFKTKYETVQALKNVNFTISQGEIIGIIGKNGAGKSTLIKLMCGILYKTNGEIKINNMNPEKDRRKISKEIGVIFGQMSQLVFELIAKDGLLFTAAIYGIKKSEALEKIMSLSKILEVENLLDIQVKKLSLGQRMRFELINSMINNPKILFLDEPTIGLDIVGKQKLWEYILKINKEYNVTIILTSHNADDIEKLCKRVIFINNGEVIIDSSLNEFKKYINEKRIYIKYSNKISDKIVEEFESRNFKIISKDDYEIEVGTINDNSVLKRVIDINSDENEILDINITDLPLDEIISTIYKDGN